MTKKRRDVVFSTSVGKCPTCNADAVDRSEFWEAAPENGREIEAKLQQVVKAVENYYLALDRREHGVVAQGAAMERIETALGMRWVRGEMTKMLEDNPKLKPFFD